MQGKKKGSPRSSRLQNLVPVPQAMALRHGVRFEHLVVHVGAEGCRVEVAIVSLQRLRGVARISARRGRGVVTGQGKGGKTYSIVPSGDVSCLGARTCGKTPSRQLRFAPQTRSATSERQHSPNPDWPPTRVPSFETKLVCSLVSHQSCVKSASTSVVCTSTEFGDKGSVSLRALFLLPRPFSSPARSLETHYRTSRGRADEG